MRGGKEGLYSLSEIQKEIVGHTKGAALVLAGPGSGKTTVIASRVVRLEREVTKPENILTLCFGREAAAEMKRRYLIYRETDSKDQAAFSTVHSICFRILTDVRGGKIDVLEGQKKIAALSKIYERINGRKNIDIEQLVNSISRQRNISAYGRKIIPQIYRFYEICDEYERYKKDRGLIDYDDMIFEAYDRLCASDRLVKKYAREYVQADEAQDLSEMQFKIIKMLSSEGNIFTVADDDQSIYGFRGAAPECIINYTKIFPDAKVYRLEENFRSTGSIVEYASDVSHKNEVRCEKTIFTGKDRGEEVETVRFSTGILQAKTIVSYIKKMLRSDGGSNVGILYRNNLSSLIIMLMLFKNGIDFRISGEYQDPRKLYMVDRFLKELKKQEKKKIMLTAAVLLQKMRRKGLLEDSILNCELTGKQKRTVWSSYDFLLVLCRYANSYEECVKYIELIAKAGDAADKEGARVFLSTVHSAKGLEFDTVFVIDLVKDEFPGKGAYSGPLLEEERRLFYVAVTRARSKLFVTYPEKRGGMPEEKSIFIAERSKTW